MQHLPSPRFSLCIVWLGAMLTAISFGQTRSNTPKHEAIHYCGHVVDRSTGKPIDAAYVSLIPGTHAAWRTDSAGRFCFWTSEESDRIQIEQAGYQGLTLATKGHGLHHPQLEPAPAAGLDKALLTASGTGRWMPPSQYVAPAIITAESGSKSSGIGENWSPWYRLAVGTAPTGYTVHRDEFWLSGDRTCGFFAECRQISKNDHEVAWEFRLQGHGETGAPAKTYSVAHLRVLYRPE